jgi:hypothetical protein
MSQLVSLHTISNYCFLGSLKEHFFNKEKLLNEINNSPFEKYNNISKCDWGIERKFERIYQNTFFSLIHPYLIEACKLINAENFNMHQFWFQQYEKDSEHEWHIHPSTNYTGVYYVEYPDKNAKTEILDFKTKKIFTMGDIKEGDVLIFPSNLVHRAPKIKNNLRKTIISFNIDFNKFNINVDNND